MSRGAKVAMAHVTPGTLHESLKGEAAWGAALKPWLRAFYRAARVVVAVSPATARELRQMSVGGIEIITSFLGVDCVGRPKQATLRGQSRRKLVLGVGQLQPRKGIDDFARVAAQVPDHDFVWVGGRPFGPLTAGGLNGRQLRRLATRNLRFTGRVSDASLQALYERANAFLFLSRQENFGQVVVEAANHRTPLLLSRIPAFEDHFQEGAALIEPAQAPNRLANLFSSGELSDELASRSHTLSTRFSATRAASDLISQLHEAQLVRESQPA
jgi:1,2-diacylglycerol-3-alpha-glucose alpha-1,2-galactosyltransferase